MKKIIFAFLLLAVPVAASEWALVNSSGTVTTVIVSDSGSVPGTGLWVLTPGKVGIGWTFTVYESSSVFSAPVSTNTVCAHPEIPGFCQ